MQPPGERGNREQGLHRILPGVEHACHPLERTYLSPLYRLLRATAALACLLLAGSGSACGQESSAADAAEEADLRARLTPLQYRVTQEDGTEPAFRNAYWDEHRARIYVDVVSGEPLFSSLDKYNSGTGWPSFTRPLEPANIVTHTDIQADHTAHRGPLEEGRQPPGPRIRRRPSADRPALLHEQVRRCASFPPNAMEAEGYGQYLPLFR